MVSITAEVSVPRGGTGPTFLLDPSPNGFAAVEVARGAALLAPAARSEGTAAAFFGSWETGRLSAEREYRLPTTAWAALRSADRLHYRCVTSAEPDAWVDVAASVPDDRLELAPCTRVVDVQRDPDQVPAERLDRLWRDVLRDAATGRLTARPGAVGTVVRHSSSPRRPASPHSVVWVVAVVGPPQDGVVTEVVVPVAETGEVGPIRWRTPAAHPVDGLAAATASAQAGLDPPLAAALAARPDRFVRRGRVWVWQDGAPAPTEGIGGTVLVSAATGTVLFSARTSW